MRKERQRHRERKRRREKVRPSEGKVEKKKHSAKLIKVSSSVFFLLDLTKNVTTRGQRRFLKKDVGT